MDFLSNTKEQTAMDLIRAAEDFPVHLTVYGAAKFLGTGRITRKF